ncbi:MAG: nucleotidyl transferase AbiEii/AbiGii toxin family protein [Bacteroidales bacterium]|nr:nucleotidyl transferase AbiEii/AbiGii toxin family protein [Bacteroidales bacterium]
MNELYRKQVALLIRIMPSVNRIQDFAVHGGTAINLFHKNMPRYSVDIDITYIPVQGRDESLKAINMHLVELMQMIEKTIPGIRITHKSDIWKLLCVKDGATVKIEVNGTKRGIIGVTEDKSLCAKAQAEFNMGCTARIVSFTQLYGGKISAALSRQHPRDLFDCKYMPLESLDQAKDGLLLCLLGSDKPILESLQPNPVDQTEALKNQFEGMTDVPFSYEDYEATRKELIEIVNKLFTKGEKEFFVSFEQGEPEWSKCCAGDLSVFPSVKWKLQNIQKLRETNPLKHGEGVEKLREYLFE